MDFHLVQELTGAAYRAYSNYATLHHLSGQIQAQAQVALARKSTDWALARIEDARQWLLGREAKFLGAKVAISANTGNRSALMKMSPETLGMYLANIMETREPGDFKSILYILGSAVHRKGKGADPSPDHKLKWVIRYLSGIEIPVGGALKEERKEAALKAGLKKLDDFGNGIGFSEAKRNEQFFRDLIPLLMENGIDPA